MVHYLQPRRHQTGCRRRLHLHLHRLWRHLDGGAPALVATVGSHHLSSDGTKLAAVVAITAHLHLHRLWRHLDGAHPAPVASWGPLLPAQTAPNWRLWYTAAPSTPVHRPGATWTERTSAGSRDWQSITSNSDGNGWQAASLLRLHLHLHATPAPPGRSAPVPAAAVTGSTSADGTVGGRLHDGYIYNRPSAPPGPGAVPQP